MKSRPKVRCIQLYVRRITGSFVIVFRLFVLSLVAGCGGGGSSCSSDTPLECSNGTCCPRGYPYSCGTGYCYQYGCPAGSPSFNVCDLKVANDDSGLKELSVPVIDEDKAKMCVPEAYPVEDTLEPGDVK